MKNVLTAEQVRRAEAGMNKRGVDNMFLRLNASLAVADGISDRAGADVITAVFCGAGGNGYDGVLAAIRLKRQGKEVRVYIVGEFEAVKAKLGAVLDFAAAENVPVYPASAYCGKEKILIDAIFGIGLNRPIVGETAELIETLNAARDVFRLAVDIPSGLDANTGEVLGVAFRADVTLTFACYKRGMLFGAGREFCGRIIVEDVGIATESDVKVYEDGDFPVYKRNPNAHKGASGRIYIVGGCGEMIGAPLISAAAAHAAYLNGAGTVTVCVPSVHRVALASRCTMSMMKFMPDSPEGFIKFDRQAFDDIMRRADAIDIGMGMGKNPELKAIVKYLCENYTGALVIDADGLNAISGDYAFIKSAKPKVVLTPHVGEFRRLTGSDATVENAVALARETGAIVVLKSSTTIITDGRETRINISGTPAMAKGGMGDLLGGCITSLMCSFTPFDAATVACYRNGIGAERAVSSYAEMMLTAHDVLHMANYSELEDV